MDKRASACTSSQISSKFTRRRFHAVYRVSFYRCRCGMILMIPFVNPRHATSCCGSTRQQLMLSRCPFLWVGMKGRKLRSSHLQPERLISGRTLKVWNDSPPTESRGARTIHLGPNTEGPEGLDSGRIPKGPNDSPPTEHPRTRRTDLGPNTRGFSATRLRPNTVHFCHLPCHHPFLARISPCLHAAPLPPSSMKV